MKELLVAGIGALALLAGNAFAEGCRYGSVVSMASVDEAAESDPRSEVDAKLLALLREEQDAEVPAVHN